MENIQAKQSYTKALSVFVACCLLMGVGFALPSPCFSVFVAPIVETLNTSVTSVAMYFTCLTGAGIVSSIFGSKVLDRFGRWAIVVAGVLMGAGFLILAAFPSLPTLYLAAIVAGLCYPVVSIILVPLLLNKWFVKKQGTFLGITMAMSGLFTALLSPVFTSMIGSMGWRPTLTVLGLTSLIVIVLLGLFVVRMSPQECGALPYGGTQDDLAAASEGGQGASAGLPGLTLRESLKTPAFWFAACGVIFIGLTAAVFSQMNTIVQVSGFTAVVAGLALTMVSCGMVVGNVLAGYIKDKTNASVAIGIDCAFGVLGFALIAAAVPGANVALLYVGCLLFGLTMSLGTVAPTLICNDAFGPKEFGVFLGLLNAISSVGTAVSTPVMSGIYDSTGTYMPVLVGMVVGVALIAVLAIAAIRFGRSKWQQAAEA